jgi:hypothetical protein
MTQVQTLELQGYDRLGKWHAQLKESGSVCTECYEINVVAINRLYQLGLEHLRKGVQ